MNRKQGFLFFISSCMPGCGQMHQGYMKRGVSVMTLAIVVFLLAMLLNISELFVVLIPVWLFSFFDSYNLRTRLELETAPADDWLVDLSQLSGLGGRFPVLLGWILVLTGLYVLLDTVLSQVLLFLADYLGFWNLYSRFRYALPRLVVTIGIIALGIRFIRGPKQPVPTFTPPAEEDSHGSDDE